MYIYIYVYTWSTCESPALGSAAASEASAPERKASCWLAVKMDDATARSNLSLRRCSSRASSIAWEQRPLGYKVSLRPRVARSVPNLEPGKMCVYVTNGTQNGLNIGRKVGPCPGSRRRWVLGSVCACFQVLHAANTYRPRFQVRTRPS